MADTMQFDLVSPERRLASLAAREVQIPGAEGDLTAMPQHSPMITTLRPGVLTVKAEDGAESKYAVIGGFAEINENGTTVLAEHAVPAEELTPETLEQFLSDAAAARDNASAEDLDALAKTAADIAALGNDLGVAPRSGS
ncbi:MAG: F0F1 ATP synthase subunit epsilon [Vannielia sp.]|uniref:F0F1 ATP synthase subunit epsilon n=1 Tax=Rhodobacterales TaxID=204455 RepID=UPI002094E13C|nr:F0F1 ATP synthase subunit epsilon [Oceanicola sp. 502str15]MCO6385153.1 F0F1 ATP synthase subunit epsilon [Oceanicola sp. 502str15]